MASIGNRVELTVSPGTNPEPDETELATLFYTATSGVYFYKSASRYKLRKLPGYMRALFANNQVLAGAARSLDSYRTSINHYIIGTNTRLYTYENGGLYNITPFSTSSVTAANSLATDHITLGSNPIVTTLGSMTVTFNDTAHKLQSGDSVIVAGATATGGLSTGQLNTTFVVRSTTTNSFTVTASAAATSNATGGGASVIVSSAIIRITKTAHGLSNGDRVSISGAATTGGIPSTEINIEQIIRSVSANTFDIVAVTKATSLVTSGGGGSTIFYPPIPAGPVDYSQGFGWGGGLWGVGLWGVGAPFINTFTYPQIWSGGRYGNDYITTPGQQQPIYIWQNDITAAPAILSGAPSAVTWVTIIDNFVLALGGGGVKNRIQVSDASDATDWTPDPASYAYLDDLEGAEELISSVELKSNNLIFSNNRIYSFTFLDKPDIWDTKTAYPDDGIIAPKAFIVVGENCYIMGTTGFLMYDGANMTKIEPITCRDYIYKNLNFSAAWKIHCRHDTKRDQIIFCFPLFDSSECNYQMIYNIVDGHATLNMESSTAAEISVLQENSPYTVNSDGTNPGFIYRRDIGNDADGVILDWFAETNYAMIGSGDNTMEIMEITPDGTQSGNLDITIFTKDYAQSTEEFTYGPYEVTPTTSFIDPQASGRQRKYRFEGSALGEDFSMGKYFETVIQGPPL